MACTLSLCVVIADSEYSVSLKRTTISTPKAPAAIGPYSQAIAIDSAGIRQLYIAGQIGLSPPTGKIVPGGISNETRRVMTNIAAIVDAAGGKMSDIVECNVLMADLNEYAAFNVEYAKVFDADNAPARAAYQVVALPKDARAEVKCSAVFVSPSQKPAQKCGGRCSTDDDCEGGKDGCFHCTETIGTGGNTCTNVG